jgi:hypothetical protein
LALVRLLLSVALAIVIGAFVLYLVKRDRRYLRFIGQVGKYTILLLLAVFAFYAVRRALGGG